MEKFKDYRRLISFIKPHTWIFVGSIACMGISSVLLNVTSVGAIIPFVDIVLGGKKISLPEQSNLPQAAKEVSYNLINYINSFEPLQLLGYLVMSILVLFLIKEVFTFLQNYLIRDLSFRVVRDIKNKMYHKLLNLSLDFYSLSRAGQLVSKITYDVGIIQSAVAEGLRDLIFESIQLIVLFTLLIGIILAYAIPWWLVLLILIVMPSIIYPVIRIGKRLRVISTSAQEKMADINSILYETFSGIRIVKAFDMSSYESNKFKSQNQRFYKIMIKSVKRLVAINPLTEYVSVCAGCLIVYFGGREVITRGLDSAGFVAFIFLLLSMSKPFNRLSKVHIINQQALAAATRIFGILDKEPTIKEIENPLTLEEFKNTIILKNVFFKYDRGDILKDINLKVLKGEVIAIVGRSGVGKTTLINLIPRFYDATKGHIFIDDLDVRNLTLTSLRRQIGIVTQETILFNDTVKANIAYGKIDAKLEEIENAATLANADEFINQLPQKYDTMIGDRGFRLSGGQRQRLAIARAILKNPPILILDEATSQLDTESEKLVQNALGHLIEGRTVFVIAHRLSTIKYASRIIVLDEGRIAEVGTHKELIEKDSLYKKLYDLQFKDA